MSIIATQSAPADPSSAAGTASDATATAIFLGFVVVFAAAGAVAAWRLRVYRPRTVLGPVRVPPTGEVWPLGVTLIAAFLALVVGSTAGVALAANLSGITYQAALTDESAGVVAGLVGTVGALVFAAGLLAVVSRESLAALGLTAGHLRKALAVAAVAALIAIPWTYAVGYGTEWAYRAIEYEHPAEHDLLRTMRNAGPAVKWGAVAAAVIVAPLAEEFFFRGLIQTMLRHLFAQWFGRRPTVALPDFPAAAPAYATPVQFVPELPPGAGPIGTTAAVAPLPVIVSYAEPQPPAPPPPAAWMGWMAIVVTSVIFGLVHPLWTFPIIFFLSVAMGYVYERTGNLWASIGLHAAFNALNVALYLGNVT